MSAQRRPVRPGSLVLVSRVQWNEHSPSQVPGSVHRVKHFCRPCCLKEDSNADRAICICDWDYFDHRLCAIRLKGWAGRTLAVIVVLSVSYFGPQVFGKDWFQEGYIAGIVLGGFAWEAFEDRSEVLITSKGDRS
jgi:hypothetical protein